jgi:hypothetical protein
MPTWLPSPFLSLVREEKNARHDNLKVSCSFLARLLVFVMSDPLSISAGVAGLLSLGIQVMQSLISVGQRYSVSDIHLSTWGFRASRYLSALTSHIQVPF